MFEGLTKILKVGFVAAALLGTTSCGLLFDFPYDVDIRVLEDALTLKRGESVIVATEVSGGRIDRDNFLFDVGIYLDSDEQYDPDLFTLTLVAPSEGWSCNSEEFADVPSLSCRYEEGELFQTFKVKITASEATPVGESNLNISVFTGRMCLAPFAACTNYDVAAQAISLSVIE